MSDLVATSSGPPTFLVYSTRHAHPTAPAARSSLGYATFQSSIVRPIESALLSKPRCSTVSPLPSSTRLRTKRSRSGIEASSGPRNMSFSGILGAASPSLKSAHSARSSSSSWVVAGTGSEGPAAAP